MEMKYVLCIIIGLLLFIYFLQSGSNGFSVGIAKMGEKCDDENPCEELLYCINGYKM